jgi:hypothetical protein
MNPFWLSKELAPLPAKSTVVLYRILFANVKCLLAWGTAHSKEESRPLLPRFAAVARL